MFRERDIDFLFSTHHNRGRKLETFENHADVTSVGLMHTFAAEAGKARDESS
jgi:hypothetical protein